MAFQLVVNIVIAIIWMFLTESYSFTSFFIGFLLGIGMLFLFNRFIPDSFYFKYVWAIVKLIVLFIKELILSNLSVLKLVYKPKLEIKPGIIALPTDLNRNWEITILANLITLTPGTLSIDVSPDNRYIYIHVMDMPDVDEAIMQIKNTFEKAIMEVTR